ncbi:ribosome biogenesis (Nop4), putative [Talaromyces stipitatus ATCC 10500]|uniref:Ribosome biogenesis (Nop4), putative n=1 Tax=Talaromyces stipitatus (strain ATCC 10500 / CBS 375.48 / QM 6759 / NRRL 1006) TaxID=441959 RepID=B8LUD2_TALSN|nr:ribosome biogenesis (Nop4), putative [Talaromyces stipitatus ATCC 10500]EED23705.1 ribosome biogenesis (Nop4), putative [Talaromyces stipitatus ATCC 10500]
MADDSNKRRRLSEDGSFKPQTAEEIVLEKNETNGESKETPAKPQMRRELFVRSLPASATTEKLTGFFSQSYVIKHATVVIDPETKQSKGYGFVTFADIEDAQRALEEFNGVEFEGRKIKVEVAQPRKREIDEKEGKSVPTAEAARLKAERTKQREQTQPPKLIVRNLPWTIKDSDQLAALFRSFGKVKHAVVPKKGNVQAGFGFVVLRGRKNAEKALEAVNGKEIDGRTLAVDWAVEKNVWEEAQQTAEKKDEDAMEVDDAKSDEAGAEDEEDESVGVASEDGDEEGSFDEDDEDEDDEDDEGEEDDRNSSTIFIRNLPFTTTDESLYEHFKQFGPLRYAQRPRGTGFVCFWKAEDAIECLRGAPRQVDAGKEDAHSKKHSTSIKQSVLQNDMLDPSGKYTIEDRVLNVTLAVSKTEANKLTEEGVSRRSERDKDRRRLFLLNEGTINTSSPLYKKLAPSEIKMREDSLKQRQNLIKNNPTLHLSLTRLSIRNIPRSVTSKDLKALAREAVVGFAKDAKEGRRQPLSTDELSRDSEETKVDDKRRREKGKGIVKQAKIVFEGRDGSKIEEKTGAGRSRGYGFVEYYTHRHALMGLRWLNGHVVQVKSRDGDTEKKKRLIVEFAIENAQVVKRRKEFQERARNKQEEGAEKGGDNGKRGMKRKRPEGRPNNKGDKTKDKKVDADEDEDEDQKNKIAKRNRIIARKRQQRRQRKGKA